MTTMEDAPDGNPIAQVPLSVGGQVPVNHFDFLPRLTVLADEDPLFDKPSLPNPFFITDSKLGNFGERERPESIPGDSSKTILEQKSPISTENGKENPHPPFVCSVVPSPTLSAFPLVGGRAGGKESVSSDYTSPQKNSFEKTLSSETPKTPSPKGVQPTRHPGRFLSFGGRGRGRGRSNSTISPTFIPELKTPEFSGSNSRAQTPSPLRGEDFSLDNIDSRKELIFERRGGTPVNLENPSAKFLCGYVVIVQMTPFGSTLLWSGVDFFRVQSDSFDKFPKPLTPVQFKTEFTPHRRGTGTGQKIQTFCAELVGLCTDKEGNPPRVKGFFTFQDDKKFVFNWNPEGAFPNFIKCTVYRDTLPPVFRDNLRLNSACSVVFSPGRPPRNQIGAGLPVISDVSTFDTPLPPSAGPPTLEPVNGAFPPEALQDFKELAQFNIHIVVGLPDNDIIPSLSYSDFVLLKNYGTLSWTTVEAKVGEKYTMLKSSETKSVAERAELFSVRLGQHRNNKGGGGKNILIVPGLWPELTQSGATSFADNIVKFSSFGAFVALPAHPLSTAENVHELNPHICGNFSHPTVEACFYSDTPIATGELNPFTEEMDFTLARNAKKYLFLQMKKIEVDGKFPTDGAPMFKRPFPFDFKNYLGLPHKKTGSEITTDQFVLFSVESSLRKTLNCFPRSGNPCKILPDPAAICSNYAQAQIYSAEENLSREKAFKIYASAADNSEAPLIGSSFCSSATVVRPCSPENDIRVIKISNLASVRGNENKTAVLVLLDQLGLAAETFPFSRFYYKIRRSSASDQALIETLTSFNRSMPRDGPLFHSVYDGTSTQTLVYRRPPPAPPPPPPVPKKRASPCALLVIDPPFSLSLSKVADWAHDKLPCPREPCWGLTPTQQNCIVVEFFPDETDSFQTLSSHEFDGASYAVRFFLNLPRNYHVYRTDSVSESSDAKVPSPLPERKLPPLPKHFISIVEKLLPKPSSEQKREG